MQNLVVKCPFDISLHKEILEMPVEIKEIFNLKLEKPVKKTRSWILLPVIGLIYTERMTQTNVVFKVFICRIWERIKKSGQLQTRENLSKFYQLEFLEEIQKVLKNLEKKQPHEEILIKEVFPGIIDLVTELKFVGLEFPCRILRRGNVEIFEKFVGVLKKIVSLNCSDLSNNSILDCLREFERFFHQQYTIFLNDFVMEFEKQSGEANFVKSIQDSWKVIGKFTLLSEIHEINEKISGSNPDNPKFNYLDQLIKWNEYFDKMESNLSYYFCLRQINGVLIFLKENETFKFDNYSDLNGKDYSGFESIQTLDKIDDIIHNESITNEDFSQKFNQEEMEQIKNALEIFNVSPESSIKVKKSYLKGFIRYLQYKKFKKVVKRKSQTRRSFEPKDI